MSGYNYSFNNNFKTGFNSGKDVFEPYLLTSKDIKYYDTYKPYTRVFYTLGTKKEQNIDIIHTQNIKPNWNMAAHLKRFQNQGTFTRMNSIFNNATLSSIYIAKKGRVQNISNAYGNKSTCYENYGIADETMFFVSGFSNKALVNVNSNSAINSRVSFGGESKTYFNFNLKTNQIIDSTKTKKEFTHRIVLLNSYDRNWRNYKDTDPTNIVDSKDLLLNDTTYTHDSIIQTRFTNGIKLQGIKNSKFTYSLGYTLEYFDLYSYYKKDKIKAAKYLNSVADNNHIADFYLNHNISKDKLTYHELLGEYVIAGYNMGDKYLKYEFTKKIVAHTDSSLERGKFNFGTQYSQKRADFFYTEFASNTHFWEIDSFLKPATTRIYASYFVNKLKLSLAINYYLLDNFIYYDSRMIPVQNNKTRDLFVARIEKHFKWKKLNFIPRVTYQKSTQPGLRVPELMSRTSLYIEKMVFKKASLAQFGFDGWYMSKTMGYAYNPELGNFYLNRNSTIAAYPIIDFYISFKISSFKMFFKIEHLNAGFMGNIYQQFHQYPWSDRTFKLGVIWDFNG